MSVDEMDRPRGARPWQSEQIWLAVVVLLAIALYLKTFAYFWREWMSETQYSLAFLVPFVSGYFTWKKWPEVVKCEKRPSSLGLALIVLALFMHIGGVVLDISGPSSVSILLYLVGGMICFHGMNVVRVLWFSLAYLVFAVPVPGGVTDIIGFPLQLWASGATAVILQAFGIEVSRAGVSLSVPGFDFQVAEACSGMSSLVALIGVTAVFAYLTRLPAKLKWLLFFMAIPIALVANVARITTIALVGYQWGQRAAIDIYHDWSSPILFMVAILLLFAISGGLEWLVGRRTTR